MKTIVCKILDIIYLFKTNKIFLSNKYTLDTKLILITNYQNELVLLKYKIKGGIID